LPTGHYAVFTASKRLAMNDSKGIDSSKTAGAGALIFVVDDEPMLLELAAVILEPLGYKVKTFRDPKAAVDAYTAARPRPELVITDYAMHTMNGMDLIKLCRDLNPKQRVLLISGTVDENIFRKAKVKPDRFLPKPYQTRQLVELVEELLSNHIEL
jgi:DNA-binding NtrC family response regulator